MHSNGFFAYITGVDTVIWEPQAGPQFMALTCPYDVIFYGGARGGGKTDCALGRQIKGALTYGRAWNGLVIRKNYKNFAEIRRRIHELRGMGLPAKLIGGEQQTNYLRFDNGATVILVAVSMAQELEQFQGHQYTEITIEEGTNFPFFMDMVDKLLGCLRSPHGVKCTMFITGNPGGPGHNQVKDMFITSADPYQVHADDYDNTFVFIPAKVYDNRVLVDNDPRYVRRLESIKNPELRRAWLEGDWDVVAGGFFSDIWDRSTHIVPPFEPPRSWPRGMSMDWGSSTPFSVGWYTVSDGTPIRDYPVIFQRGAVIRYDEWYGCKRDMPNVGLRMDSMDVAYGIKDREKKRGEQYTNFQRIADPSIFSKHDGLSIAEKFAQQGIVFSPANRERELGWDECKYRLRGNTQGPLFYVTENCRGFLRTVPILVTDEDNWEDIDTDQEDHVADEWRYYLMSRPRRKKTEFEERLTMTEDNWWANVFDPTAGY